MPSAASVSMKIKLQLNHEELECLHRALQETIKTTKQEVSRTDDKEFREKVQHELSVLRSLEDRIVGYLGSRAIEPERKSA